MYDTLCTMGKSGEGEIRVGRVVEFYSTTMNIVGDDSSNSMCLASFTLTVCRLVGSAKQSLAVLPPVIYCSR